MPVATAVGRWASVGAVVSVAVRLDGAPGPTVVRDRSLPVRLTALVEIGERTQQSLMREVERIWERAGVHIDWAPATNAPSRAAGSDLRVLVAATTGTSSGIEEHAWPVAELVTDQNGHPVAVASLIAADQVLAVSRHANDPARLTEQRRGVILGRAIAHEIGHFLLNSAGHAPQGLMRARIGAIDFADPRDGGFWLDPEATRWVQTSRSTDARDAGAVLARFTYDR
jgi:hypothetical protein